MQIQLIPYRLRLRQPWVSARGALTAREGWLVIATQGAIRGYGDCAPLPDAGTEDIQQAGSRLADWVVRARGVSADKLLEDLSVGHPTTPSADAAVESALLDWSARAAGVSLAQFLTPDSRPADRVAVNAALGALMSCAPEAIQAQRGAGFRVFKLKVGTGSPDEELARLRNLSPLLESDEQLRLDANGAWDEASGSAFLRELNEIIRPSAGRLPLIESIEEPLREPDDGALARLQSQTRIPLALDESLPKRPQPILPEDLPVQRIILKPPVIGGLRPTLALARSALAADVQPVITSLIDSAAGLWASTQLAAAVAGLDDRQLTTGLCHGLATANWLLDDLGEPPRPAHGSLSLPRQAGSGFSPTDAAAG